MGPDACGGWSGVSGVPGLGVSILPRQCQKSVPNCQCGTENKEWRDAARTLDKCSISSDDFSSTSSASWCPHLLPQFLPRVQTEISALQQRSLVKSNSPGSSSANSSGSGSGTVARRSSLSHQVPMPQVRGNSSAPVLTSAVVVPWSRSHRKASLQPRVESLRRSLRRPSYHWDQSPTRCFCSCLSTFSSLQAVSRELPQSLTKERSFFEQRFPHLTAILQSEKPGYNSPSSLSFGLSKNEGEDDDSASSESDAPEQEKDYEAGSGKPKDAFYGGESFKRRSLITRPHSGGRTTFQLNRNSYHLKVLNDKDGDYSYAYDCSLSPAFIIKNSEQKEDPEREENIYEEISEVKNRERALISSLSSSMGTDSGSVEEQRGSRQTSSSKVYESNNNNYYSSKADKSVQVMVNSSDESSSVIGHHQANARRGYGSWVGAADSSIQHSQVPGKKSSSSSSSYPGSSSWLKAMKLLAPSGVEGHLMETDRSKSKSKSRANEASDKGAKKNGSWISKFNFLPSKDSGKLVNSGDPTMIVRDFSAIRGSRIRSENLRLSISKQ